jgi:hypothetical protein
MLIMVEKNQHSDIIFYNTPNSNVKMEGGNCSKNSSSSEGQLFPFRKQFGAKVAALKAW